MEIGLCYYGLRVGEWRRVVRERNGVKYFMVIGMFERVLIMVLKLL